MYVGPPAIQDVISCLEVDFPSEPLMLHSQVVSGHHGWIEIVPSMHHQVVGLVQEVVRDGQARRELPVASSGCCVSAWFSGSSPI